MEKTITNGVVKACCQDLGNLKTLDEECRNGLTVKQCQVCGCRHRRLMVEPGVIGMRLQHMGR